MKGKSIVWSLGITCLLLLGLFMSKEAGAPADNRREFDHVGNFNFIVEIEGLTAGRFEAVDGLDSETEVIEYQNGDDPIIRKRPGRTTFDNITLERGYADESMDDLRQWREQIIQGKVERRSGSVILLNRKGEELLRYNFDNAWPSKLICGDLDGKGDDISIEEVKLAVETADVEFKKLPSAELRFPK